MLHYEKAFTYFKVYQFSLSAQVNINILQKNNKKIGMPSGT